MSKIGNLSVTMKISVKILVLLINQSVSFLIIDTFNTTSNDAILRNFTHTIFNDGKSDTRITLKATILDRIYGAWANASICVPDPMSADDESCGLQVLNQRVDLKKIINEGEKRNVLVNIIVENILKTANIPVRFPLEKV